MNQTPDMAVRLYGTDEPVEPMRTLTAGPLTAQFDQGALRFIKINGKEAIRNIAFVVRDKDWGTYNPVIKKLSIEQQDNSFEISFEANCKDDKQQFHYSASITGNSDGTLEFTGVGTAMTDFLTNRTGFVVLHPVEGVSGFPVEVEHVDGSIVQSEFPELVDPVQPFKDIRALTHEVSPGIKVSCRMEGDTFEMEDHRQWNDASYKTYVRPIGLPWPYTLSALEKLEQSIRLTVTGDLSVSATAGDEMCNINVGNSVIGKMPQIGLGLEPQHSEAAMQHTQLLQHIAPQVVIAWHDLRDSHGVDELKRADALASSIGASLVLEALIPCDDFKQEIDTVAAQARTAGVTFSAVSFSPAEYLKSIMPGTAWPDVPALANIYSAVRAAFPNTVIGGGMFSFFPELNRHRPPVDSLDYITHTSNTITHACDDITVTENLEAIPYIIKTCRSFARGKPYRVGPSSIGMRFNPYGSRTMDNPDNQRIAMARMEPRQRGLINAAWTIGYVSHMARGDADVVALHAPVGEFGLIYHQMEWQQPWFDDADAVVYPAFHAVAGLAAAAGAPRLDATSSHSHDVECVAYQSDDKTVLWVTNLTAQQQRIELTGLPSAQRTMSTLDAESFENCVSSASAFTQSAAEQSTDTMMIEAYSTVCIKCLST